MTKEYQQIRLQYSLESRMRIGHRKIGNLQTTRLYVPGITLWGSAVNRLVHHFSGKLPVEGGDPFRFWGSFLQEYCRFSYLFLLDSGAGLLIPSDQQKRTFIEQEYLTSTTHIAIRHDDVVAEEGMLHELEWIMPVSRSGKPTKFEGWLDVSFGGNSVAAIETDGEEVRIKCGAYTEPLREILAIATVGADLNVGCGRLRVENWKSEGIAKDMAGDSPVPGHLMAEGITAVGRLETVAGRLWMSPRAEDRHSTRRPGGYLYQDQAYAPGAMTNNKLRMDEWGRFSLCQS